MCAVHNLLDFYSLWCVFGKEALSASLHMLPGIFNFGFVVASASLLTIEAVIGCGYDVKRFRWFNSFHLV